MKLNKVIATFDCDLRNSHGTCDEFQILYTKNVGLFIKYRFIKSNEEGGTMFFKASIESFERLFDVKLGESEQIAILVLEYKRNLLLNEFLSERD